MLQIAVCEDNQQCLSNLCKMIENILFKKHIDGIIVCKTSNPQEIENIVKQQKANTFFLDIDLNTDQSGYELAQKIRKIDTKAYIVFVTGHFEFVLHAFKVHSFDYLPKPVTDEILEHCILRIFNDYLANSAIVDLQEKYITIKVGAVVHRINCSEVVYVEKLTPKTIIHTVSGEICSYISLETLENMLDSKMFIRCHRSFIANRKYIYKICLKTNTIFFHTNQTCLIGKKYKIRLKNL